jgi:hypothetical protein
MSLGHTKEDRINTVYGGGGHVVILGAGASVAATIRNPFSDGKKLPLMNNFINVVGLTKIVDDLPNHIKSDNFELLYSNLYLDDPNSKTIKEIEKKVYDYFKVLKLPDVPTIYDYLVLSLRSRDLIATFNWDPFLYQAWVRNYGKGDKPYIAFLHGNVAIGYSKIDKRSGPAGMYAKATKKFMTPTRLLYPVTQKNYNEDEYIKSQWAMLENFLSDKNVKLVTVFGYGAPDTDIEAVNIMDKAWGGGNVRNMEQFEIVDVRPETEVVRQWSKFIESHHYDYASNYFESSLASNPRRTSESYFQHIEPLTINEAFSASNPVPDNFKTLKEMRQWFKPLFDAEEKLEKQNKLQKKSSS